MTNHAELGDTGKKTGYYLSEVSHPYYVFTEAGFTVDFVSPTGGAAPMDPKSEDRSDPINAQFLDDAELMGRLEDTLAPNEVDAEDYVAVYYPGGHGTMWDLAETPELAKTAAAVYESGGVVGAVCHGPVGLVNIELSDGSYLVAGKKVAAFTNEEERAVELEEVVPFLLQDKLEERGAEFVEGEKFKENVVVDERLVTGQNPASAKAAAEAMVEEIQK
ncbi:type 1 glutamine amidotransferase domain-containing protein [Persicimonas caeni]|uniref:Type 1 glutamine amidotransferase domain-containing protein n=2 Tax=Persicimonas caeni TaxID=2292766 RepID=A0A4Y6Q334_PERCE|nr:type 1 glutamine amidotransferase domain-containing protein [Persicimonas caeni]QED36082.1 type 1 glutamine amidotransferase domain-containing protein [Persicimonas caeni]